MPDSESQNRPESESETNPREAFEFALENAETKAPQSLDDSMQEADTARLPHPGEVFQYVGDYELVNEIACGAMGKVFRGVQRSLKRDVAVKMIHLSLASDPGLRQRFRIEAEAVASLDHPNIVPVYEVGEHQGYLYFSMRYLAGGNLASGLPAEPGEGSRRHQQRIAKVVSRIARGTHHAHQRGILHRDLKPSNVLLDETGEPVITDFGLAKFADQDSGLTRSEAALGTPAYMSPEQASGRTREISVASDVYSIGAILYELLTGRAPFTGGSHLEIMRRAADEAPMPPRQIRPDLAPNLEVICLKALNKTPRARYGSADDLADDLDRWQRGEAILARRIGLGERLWLWARRHPALASVSATAMLLMLVITIGLPVGMVQINQARLAEKDERQRAENVLNRSRMTEADSLFEQDESGKALAYLAAIVEAAPNNPASGEKLIYNLIYRNWVLPENGLSASAGEVLKAVLDDSGERLLLLRNDASLEMHDLASKVIHSTDHRVTKARELLWHPDGNRFVIVGEESFALCSLSHPLESSVPVATAESLYRAFFDPSGGFLFTQGKNTGRLMVFQLADLNSAPWIIPEPESITGLEFRPDAFEVAIVGDTGLSVWNYLDQQRVLGPIPNIEMATYWQTGDWLFTDTDWRPPTDQGIEAQLTGGIIRSSDTGDEIVSLSTLSSPTSEQWPSALPTNPAELWYGFARNKQASRPLGSLPFDEPSPGGQQLVRREHQTFQRTQVRPELHSILRARAGERSLLPDWEAFDLRHSKNGQRLVLTHPIQNLRQLWDAVRRRPLFEWEPRGSDRVSENAQASRFVRFAPEEAAMIWRARETSALPAIWPTPDSAEKALFLEAGKRIMTIDFAGKLRVHDANTLTPISTTETPLILNRFSKRGSIELFRSLKNLEVLAIGTAEGSLQLWNGIRSEPLTEVMMHPTKVDEIYWHPTVNRLVTLYDSGSGRTAWIWNLESGEQILESDGWEVPPCVAVSDQGHWLMLQTGEQTLRIWDARNDRWHGNQIRLSRQSRDRRGRPSYGAGFSPNNESFFTYADGVLELRQMADGTSLCRIESGLIRSEGEKIVTFLDQGRNLLIAAATGFVVCDTQTGEPHFPTVPLPDLRHARAAGETRVMTATALKNDMTQIDLWDSRTGQNSGTPFRLRGSLLSWQTASTGDRILLVSNEEWLLWNPLQEVVLFRRSFVQRGSSQGMRIPLESPTARLSPDSESVMVLHDSPAHALSVWSFPRVRDELPPEAIALATSVGGFRLAPDDSLQTVPPSEYLKLSRKLEDGPSISNQKAWMRWFISPPETREISPYSDVRASEYANRLLTSDTLSGVLEVIRRHPQHERAWTLLREIISPNTPTEQLNDAETLEKAGDLLLGFEAVLRGNEPSHEVRLQIAELLVNAPPFGELTRITARLSPTGWRRLISDWVIGSLSRRVPKESFTAEQLIRIAKLFKKLGFPAPYQQQWLDQGLDRLGQNIQKLETLRSEPQHSPRQKSPNIPTTPGD